MRIDVLTIFPDYLAPLQQALLGKAIAQGRMSVEVHDLRAWTYDVHKSVDDSPYGGGPGMVMKPQVWGEAIDAVCGTAEPGIAENSADQPLLVVPSPAGVPFTQQKAQEWAQHSWLVFACGRYEGIDQRVFDDASRRMPVEEVSLGDYVLVGGEVAVLAMVEATARLLPGVLGNPASAEQDSFASGTGGLLEAPCYTRPEVWRGLEVPEVLRSGNHAAIDRWRRDQALERTYRVRPELLAELSLDERDRAVVESLRQRDESRGLD